MMPHEDISDAEIDGWLRTLGITTLCQWDVLVFLYRHQASLIGADFLARLLGYASDPVVAALDVLESLGLVARSRVSQIVRLYQFTVPSDPPRADAWAQLLALAGDRIGRVRLSQRLRGGDQTAEERQQARQRFLAASQQHVRAAKERLQETRQRVQSRSGGHEPWRKAI
jgi:hypothetical protein